MLFLQSLDPQEHLEKAWENLSWANRLQGAAAMTGLATTEKILRAHQDPSRALGGQLDCLMFIHAETPSLCAGGFPVAGCV